MARITKAEQIQKLLEEGMSPKQISKEIGCPIGSVYSVKSALKRASETDEAEETKDDETTLDSSDPDFWKVRYLEAHAKLVEHGIE